MFSQNKSAKKPQPKKTASRKKRDRHEDDVVFDIDDYVENQFSLVKSKINAESAPVWNRNKLLVREIAELVVAAAVKAGQTDRGVIKNYLNELIHGGVYVRLPAMKSDYQYTPNPSLLYARWFTPQVEKIAKGLRECDLSEWLKLSISNDRHLSLLRLELLFFNDWYYKNDFVADWLAVSLFFLQTDKVNEHLQQLEDELQDYCSKLPKKMRPKQDDKGYYYLPASDEHPYQRSKILSGYLYEWAQKNGFADYAKIINYLPERKFLEMLRNKTFFKDGASAANVGGKHGAWSHMLQWYCVIEHQKKTKFLKHDPLKLFQSLGSTENRATGELWNMIFDRYNDLYFHSPEYMSETLDRPKSHLSFPLLSTSVSRLLDKMQDKSYGAKLYLKHKDEMEDGVVMREFKKAKR